jgi:CSLREA domain-containing protein
VHSTCEENLMHGLHLRFLGLLSLLVAGAASLVLVAGYARTAAPNRSAAITLRAAGRGGPYLSFNDGRELPISLATQPGAFASGKAQAQALAAADFDEDGMPDLLSAYTSGDGGVLILQRGNADAIYSDTPEAQRRKATGPFTDAPFLPDARSFELAQTPELIGTGDFDADGHFDVIVTARGADTLKLLRGDGHGGFSVPEAIALPGGVTALVAGEINRHDGLADLVVAVVTAAGAQALVFESPAGAMRGQPEIFALPAAATALALGQLDYDSPLDLVVAAGQHLLLICGRDRLLPQTAEVRSQVPAAHLEQFESESEITALSIGDFSGDWRPEVALLTAAGTLRFLQRSDRLPRASEQARAAQTKPYPINAAAPAKRLALPAAKWGLSDAVANTQARSGAPLLLAAKVSTRAKMDLLLGHVESHELQVFIDAASASSHGPRFERAAAFAADDAIVAALPMRLNIHARAGLVLLDRRHTAPSVVTATVAATYTVNTIADEFDGACDAHCTLRDAISSANNNPGADLIQFNLGAGTPKINVDNSLGPLPAITDTVTIAGNTGGATRVELHGPALASSDFNGLTLTKALSGSNSASGSVVRGLVVNNFNGAMIWLDRISNCIVENSLLGTDDAGLVARGGSGDESSNVVISQGLNHTIGGTTAAARNIISGNSLGISIRDGAEGPSSDNQVQGNYIGLNAAGNHALGNRRHGVSLDGVGFPPLNNTIGGTTAGAGNIISGNSEDGIHQQRGTGNNVFQNFIGLNAAGTAARPNGSHGISGRGSMTIGSSSAGLNVISGNDGDGVYLESAEAVFVQFNVIGANLAGTDPLPNQGSGVFIGGVGNRNNVIGGTATTGRNLISGNASTGVFILPTGATPETTNNMIKGNLIGTNAAGTAALPNGSGISITLGATGTIIGGAASDERNIISGNLSNGISLSGGASGTLIYGNYIGTDINGTMALGNGPRGILIATTATNNRIGGTAPGQGNVISGNTRDGIVIALGATGNIIQGNFIGTQADGASALGNERNGVWLISGANGNTIGGVAAGAANVIAFNSQNGVAIEGGPANRVRRNSIHSNGQLGIDLGTDGITANDAGDGDTGPNDLQNYPVLSSAINTGSGTAITGTINSTPNAALELEFYSNAACDPSGNGEGQFFLGSTVVNTDASGNASFAVTFTTLVPVGQFVTATTSLNPNNSTSEFSPCRQVTACSSSISHTSQSFAANGGTGSVNVTANADCNWTATSSAGWITITAGASGAGSGTVSYAVAAHTNNSPRSATLTIAGQTFTVLQGAHFNDVPETHPFYTLIGKLSARGVTLGCSGGNYCPASNVTREQMAIFIERALGVFTPPPGPQTPTFADVPNSGATDYGYEFIEDFVGRGITQGCIAGPPRLFCPTTNVTREQMAIFIIRALGVFTPPPGPQTPTFADVPNSGATDYGYEFIEEFYRRGITSGCQTGPPRLYCPAEAVTRAQMAVFLVRAFGL